MQCSRMLIQTRLISWSREYWSCGTVSTRLGWWHRMMSPVQLVHRCPPALYTRAGKVSLMELWRHQVGSSIGDISMLFHSVWESKISHFKMVLELLNLDGLIQFAKENVGMLSSLLESLWDLLRGNVSLLFQSSVTIFSVVLGGGTAVINFLINSVQILAKIFCFHLF